jgi:hypothetical protein
MLYDIWHKTCKSSELSVGVGRVLQREKMINSEKYFAGWSKSNDLRTSCALLIQGNFRAFSRKRELSRERKAAALRVKEEKNKFVPTVIKHT